LIRRETAEQAVGFFTAPLEFDRETVKITLKNSPKIVSL
jgi:hypothetical protein